MLHNGTHNMRDKKKESLSKAVKGITMRDAGKAPMKMMKMPDKYYPHLDLTLKQVPELADLPPKGICRLVIEAELKGYNGENYHLEIKRVGKIDASY